MPDKPHTLVIGVGHPMRGDDAVGPRVVSELGKRLTVDECGIECIPHCDPSDLPLLWQDIANVIVVDAVHAPAAAGEIWQLNPPAERLPANSSLTSSHSFGVFEAIALSESLGTLPENIELIGIVGENFCHGEQLSAEVEHAA